jgi:hypothetical protein
MKAQLLIAATLAAASLGASAKTINLGVFDDDTSSLSFDHKVGQPLPKSLSFSDFVNFTLTTSNDAALSLTFADNKLFAMKLDSWSLVESGVGVIAPVAGSTFKDIEYANLGAGTYKLTINGTLLKGFRGDSYGGNIVTQAVPEPQTLALLLAGLATCAFVARRRQAK